MTYKASHKDVDLCGAIDMDFHNLQLEELTDIFYTSQKKRSNVCRVKLDSKGFLLQRDSNTGTKEQLINLTDIVGGRCMLLKKDRRLSSCACSSSSSRSIASLGIDGTHKAGEVSAQAGGDNSAYLYVFAYVLIKKNLRGSLRRERTVLKLRFRSFDTFEENMQEADRWYKTLKSQKNATFDRAFSSVFCRRLLVMLNPKSGSGKARELFHQQVTSVLNEAELPYDLHVTKYAGYAREFVRLRNLCVYCGIVAVGGDGLFFEILNGALQRSDWKEVLKQRSLGIVPCGSGNGLARSIAHLYKEPYDSKPILGAALTITSGQTALMDVVRIELRNQIIYSFLSVGWGLISDVDIESERLRSLGYQRFTIWTLHRLINLRTYCGKISYLIKGDNPNATSYNKEELKSTTLKHSRSCNTYLDKDEHNCFQSTECVSDNEFDDVISLETSANQSFRSRCDSWFSAGSRKSTYYSISESVYHSVAGDSDCEVEGAASGDGHDTQPNGPTATAPFLHDPVPSTWTVEEGEFIMVQATYQTHLGTDVFFAPSAKLNDGTIYLVIIRGGISRSQLFNFLIGMSSGTHIPTKNNQFIKVVAVTAFRIEPSETHGILTVDGERIEFGALQGEILPGIIKVMVPK